MRHSHHHGTVGLVEDDGGQTCGLCRNYTDGFCRLYLEPIEYAYTCQRWT